MIKQSIIIENEQELIQLKLSSLIYIKIDDYLANFQSTDLNSYCVSKSLKEIESMLSNDFFRINRNCIVNLNKIKIVRKINRIVIMDNGIELVVSTRRLKKLIDTLKLS